jgi:hypothetical protein
MSSIVTGTRAAPGLLTQLGGHVLGDLDAVYLDAARAQRQRDAARTDREFEHLVAVREIEEKVDGRIQHGRRELPLGGRVVVRGDVADEHVLARPVVGIPTMLVAG